MYTINYLLDWRNLRQLLEESSSQEYFDACDFDLTDTTVLEAVSEYLQATSTLED